MDALFGIFSAFGLSVSAGLNAYIPLLVVALLAKFTDTLKLKPPFDVLTSWWIIALLIVLVIVEFLADKIPAVNHVNDAIQTVIRPIAGAIVFAASAQAITDIHPVLALAAGILVSGGVHAVKAVAVRPAVTATTGGLGNVFVSMLEDFIATVLSILAILIPILVVVLVILLVAWLISYLRRKRSKSKSTQQKKQPEYKGYPLRRLPVYLLVGTGDSMTEDMLTAMDVSFRMLQQQWLDDPRGEESVWLSLIVFANGAHQIVPLSPLNKFKAPKLTAAGGHDLGAAFNLLSQRVQEECYRRNSRQIGDFQAIVILFSDNFPTDDWEEALKKLRQETKGLIGKIVTIGTGSPKHYSLLKKIGSEFFSAENITVDTFRNILDWKNQPVSGD